MGKKSMLEMNTNSLQLVHLIKGKSINNGSNRFVIDLIDRLLREII